MAGLAGRKAEATHRDPGARPTLVFPHLLGREAPPAARHRLEDQMDGRTTQSPRLAPPRTHPTAAVMNPLLSSREMG